MGDETGATRPLVAGTVRWDGASAIVGLGTSEVVVDGDTELLRAILGDCDGRSTVLELGARHGPGASRLLATLLDSGAVVDAEQAWRVLHRQSSAGSALGRPIGDPELRGLERSTFAPDRSADLVVELDPAATTTGALARRRRSTRAGGPPAPVTFADLSSVLAAAYAVGAETDPPGLSGTVPSAGALYPLVVHVLLRAPLPPAEPGLWWHDPRTLRLHRISGETPDTEALFVPEPACAALLAGGQPIVFLSADLARPSRKYGARGYRYALIEAGAAMQAASLAATELSLPLRAIGGIDDGAVHELLGLPDAAVALLALLVGR